MTTTFILDIGELIDFRKVRLFRRQLNVEMRKASREGADVVAKFVRDMIQRGPRRTGKLRALTKGQKRRRRASARGEWPKELSGDLRRSIRVMRGTGLTSEIGSNLPYAGILESEELDREHITRAAREKEPHFQKLAQRAMRRAIRRAGR